MAEKQGYIVIDARTGTMLASENPDLQLRGNSTLKTLFAADFAERFMAEHGANTFNPADVPQPFRDQLSSMLRRSDDDAVDAFWDEPADYPTADPASMWPGNGNIAVIERMVERIGLRDTIPQPRDIREFWGFPLTTPADLARVYQYLLADDRGVGRYIMSELEHTTRFAADGQDQFFGIPAAMKVPSSAAALGGEFAVKQGWSVVSDRDGRLEAQCQRESASPERRKQLFDTMAQTTGVVPRPGQDSGLAIVVVFTAYPGLTAESGRTTLPVATRRLTSLTRDVFHQAGLTPTRRQALAGTPAGFTALPQADHNKYHGVQRAAAASRRGVRGDVNHDEVPSSLFGSSRSAPKRQRG